MHPEIEEIQSKLKEILYDCAVEIRATKSALYLYDRRESRFELITDYGFKGVGLRAVTNRNDVIVDRCGRTRSAFFVNGLVAEPLFAEMLYEAATEHLLVAPIYLRGQMVGFLDMRDKAAKQPFTNDDLQKAATIAERFVEILATKNVFGHRFISVALPIGEAEFAPMAAPQTAAPAAAPSAAPVSAARSATASASPLEAPALALPPSAGAAPQIKSTSRVVPRLTQLIAQAQVAVKAIKSQQSDEMTESEMALAREILPMIVNIPGAVAAVFSVGHAGGTQEVVANALVSPEAMVELNDRIESWLDNAGERTTFARRNISGRGEDVLTAADIQDVFTSAVEAGSMKRVFLTVAFREEPEQTAHDLMTTVHRQLESAIELSVERRSRDASRRRMAERLLEPDFVKYPELRRHTDAVVKRVDEFARFLSLNSVETENAKLLAMVHDVGMRVLDYERLYRKRDLSHEELELLKSHPIVGAAIVEPHLGRDIALMVYMHHERWGGGGYPGGVAVRTEIPLLSRILQICDAYEAMVAMDGYHLPLTYEQAMEAIARGAGNEFDPQLAERFAEMMRGVQ